MNNFDLLLEQFQEDFYLEEAKNTRDFVCVCSGDHFYLVSDGRRIKLPRRQFKGFFVTKTDKQASQVIERELELSKYRNDRSLDKRR